MGTTRKETGGHFQTADPKTEEAAGGSGRERLGWGSGKGQTVGFGYGIGWLWVRVWGGMASESGLEKGVGWGHGKGDGFVSSILLL